MKAQNLISKLIKLNIEFKIVDVNEHNKDIEFTINKMNFCAGFTATNDTITDYCRNICFDNNSQETQRIFFDNFNKLLKYTNN